jgi:hypothetical protein
MGYLRGRSPEGLQEKERAGEEKDINDQKDVKDIKDARKKEILYNSH